MLHGIVQNFTLLGCELQLIHVLFTIDACLHAAFMYHDHMSKIIGYNRNNSNSSNKTLAKQFRAATIKPIVPMGQRHKASHRARRSDYGSKRS
jgi:hypothetical protein